MFTDLAAALPNDEQKKCVHGVRWSVRGTDAEIYLEKKKHGLHFEM